MLAASLNRSFFGVHVVRAAFVLAIFGWGVGFYGPPVYLHSVIARTSWPLALVSAALTVHFLVGVSVIVNLPRLYRRFGVPATTMSGATATAVGVLGWATAIEPWQLFAAAIATGGGWVTMGAVAVNAVIAPWYARARPMALAKAYNGASIGGVIFSPLWVALIAHAGFATAAVIIGIAMVAIVATLAHAVFAKTPEMLGQLPDGDAPGTPAPHVTSPHAHPLPGGKLWRDRGFLTLAGGMAAGLFAQIGLIAHLYSLLVPALGAQTAGLAMGLATASAIAGRYAGARLMGVVADRRLIACTAYGIQLLGTVVLLAASEDQIGMIVLGIVLFGSGIGNATSLPPLIAQVEFTREDVARVIALIVAIAQATYAFAPAVFGVLLEISGAAALHIGSGTTNFFIAAAMIQLAAMACFLAGRTA